ncbi:unnamed protein product [Sphenostylis stenocarpa]|uniref:Protein EXECUTER 1, chloroplastic n=1 Tax=Sphenostylis stenocarpa TaxID=92480 RepID=A0AA86SIQ1_9FABA|nr:unnamed protein product [Sphenostylis stenocarpa]
MTLTHPSMASITSSSSPTATTQFNFQNSKLCSSFFSFSRPSLPLLSISHVVSNSPNKFNSYVLRCSASFEDAEWDWERWRDNFHEVDEQDRLIHILKSSLDDAVLLEDYDTAATLKVAIAAVASNDTVGTRAIEEERYSDAAFLRDDAGTGLVGWWVGMSKDTNDPHGLIIRITPEHGRYVARSYSPRQLATSAAGVPLFEIFLMKNKNGEFKSQAVYLKRRGGSFSPPTTSTKALDVAERLRSVESPEDRSELFVGSPEDPEVVDDRNDSSDPTEGMPGFQNILKDIIPGVKMKVLKFTTLDKVDKDITSKVIEQITEEEGDENENADEYSDKDSETELKDVNSETDDENELSSSLEIFDHAEQNKIIDDVFQKLSSSLTMRDLLRVPAMLETSGQDSFSLTIKKIVNQQVDHGKGKPSQAKSTKIQGQRSAESIMFNLAKFLRMVKLSSKVLKDVGELLSRNLSGNHERLSGSTTFRRIEIPTSLDPLNGLYIGAHGLYSADIIQLRCRYGHWQEDGGGNKDSSHLEFYEYVEALKLTGNPYVPAGQVAFRAKVGKRHQLPLMGIIPEEFGLIARYKGQGWVAEPRSRNSRWVDGELLILDGKVVSRSRLIALSCYLKSGPVVGFVYWVPDRPFLVLFNRLWLQQ